MSAFLLNGEIEEADALIREACDLTRDVSFPVDLSSLASGMGVRVEFGHSRRREYHEASLFLRDGAYVIGSHSLSQESWSVRDRFSIAHELAHVLCDRRGVGQPRRKTEYWRLEDLCDEMANRILIPETVETVPKTPTDAYSAYLAVVAVSRACTVSAESAARAVVRDSPTVTMVASLRRSVNPSTKTEGYVVWTTGSVRGVELKPGSAIRQRHQLADVLRDLPDRNLGERWRIDFDPSVDALARRHKFSVASIVLVEPTRTAPQ